MRKYIFLLMFTFLLYSSSVFANRIDVGGGGGGGGAEVNNLETITTGIAADEVPVGTAANTAVYKGVPDCDTAATSKLLYDTTTHAFSCGTDANDGGTTAWDDVGDPDNDGLTTIDFNHASENTILTNIYDAAGSFFKIDNTDADLANETSLLGLEFTADADAQATFILATDNNGDPVWKLGVDGKMTIGPGAADYILPTTRGAANTYLRDNGAGAVTFAALSGIGPANFTPSTDFGDVNTDAGGALRYGADSVDNSIVNWGNIDYLDDEGSIDVAAYAAVGAFASGDTFVCLEAGVGIRECDYDDLPGVDGGMDDWILEDADGTEISVSDAEEIKFIESTGIDIDWTDTTPGSDADPFDLTFTIEATLADISDGTIEEDLVNTAHPWADNEVADDITASLYAPLAGAIFTGGITLDDGVGDSPTLSFIDADNNYFALIKYDAGAAGLFNNEGVIRLAPSNDSGDYLEISTAAGIVTITTIADDDGDLLILAGGGDIGFGNENLITTGTFGAGASTLTSVNKVTITAPATGSTLTIEEGFTLTADGNATVQGTNTGDEAASSKTVAGVVELATTDEINTGTDSTRAIPVDQFVASKRNIRWLVFNLVEAGTANTAANNIGGDFVSPIAGTVLQSDSTPFYLYATNSTAGVTGTMVVDINFGGTSIMTTNKLDFDSTEKTTTDPATPPDLTDTTLAVGDIITIDVDSIHTTAAKGLTVYMAIRE